MIKALSSLLVSFAVVVAPFPMFTLSAQAATPGTIETDPTAVIMPIGGRGIAPSPNVVTVQGLLDEFTSMSIYGTSSIDTSGLAKKLESVNSAPLAANVLYAIGQRLGGNIYDISATMSGISNIAFAKAVITELEKNNVMLVNYSSGYIVDFALKGISSRYGSLSSKQLVQTLKGLNDTAFEAKIVLGLSMGTYPSSKGLNILSDTLRARLNNLQATDAKFTAALMPTIAASLILQHTTNGVLDTASLSAQVAYIGIAQLSDAVTRYMPAATVIAQYTKNGNIDTTALAKKLESINSAYFTAQILTTIGKRPGSNANDISQIMKNSVGLTYTKMVLAKLEQNNIRISGYSSGYIVDFALKGIAAKYAGLSASKLAKTLKGFKDTAFAAKVVLGLSMGTPVSGRSVGILSESVKANLNTLIKVNKSFAATLMPTIAKSLVASHTQNSILDSASLKAQVAFINVPLLTTAVTKLTAGR